MKKAESTSFTVGELIEAIEKNGLPQIRGSYFEYNDFRANGLPHYYGKSRYLIGACALGQAAINLGITEADSWWGDATYNKVLKKTIELNDEGLMFNFVEIASLLRAHFADVLDTRIFAYTYDWSPYISKEEK